MLVITWQIFDQYNINTTQISHLVGTQVPKTVILSRPSHNTKILHVFPSFKLQSHHKPAQTVSF